MNSVRIDLDAEVVHVMKDGQATELAFSDAAAFGVVSDLWLRLGWDTKYVYGFSWMGRPVIQLPEDLMRTQEVIYRIRPDVIVETGVAHGGSLVFYASILEAMGHQGKVIGVDIEIRPHNRAAIEAHELFGRIELIEGNSVDAMVVDRVRASVGGAERVMVLLDSKHTRAHVRAELDAYAPLVSVGSYIVAADGIMGDLAGAPRSEPSWTWDNPREAAADFVSSRDDFVLDPPVPPFNEGTVASSPTYWPGGWLRRVR